LQKYKKKANAQNNNQQTLLFIINIIKKTEMASGALPSDHFPQNNHSIKPTITS